tara:strand:- start:1852 stop:2142 length:291 start_codon:yes stop_codon:yes gene_type:complete
MIKLQEALKFAEKETGITPEEIMARGRTKEVVKARNLTASYLRTTHDMTYPQIGRLLGGYDSTTVMHMCRRCEYYKDKINDQELRRQVEEQEIKFK